MAPKGIFGVGRLDSRPWALLLAAALQAACATGGGGIEPVGLIYFTAEGAQSLSPYEIGRTGAAVEAVLAEFGVGGIEHGAEGEGAARTFSGLDEERDLEVLVRLESREKSSTQVEVKARRGPVMADQDYARRLLKRILEVARQG